MSTTETGHKHRFPCNPPGGTFHFPGPCVCGKTYRQNEADVLLAEGLHAVAAAYGVEPRVGTRWAVAYGAPDPNDPGAGFLEYDDLEGAREHVRWVDSGIVAKCAVISLPWETVTGEEPAS